MGVGEATAMITQHTSSTDRQLHDFESNRQNNPLLEEEKIDILDSTNPKAINQVYVAAKLNKSSKKVKPHALLHNEPEHEVTGSENHLVEALIKSNAVMREWAKERTELKQRVITSVEDQVEETSKQLKKDLEL